MGAVPGSFVPTKAVIAVVTHSFGVVLLVFVAAFVYLLTELIKIYVFLVGLRGASSRESESL